MIILGIDPGTAIVGYSFITKKFNEYIPLDFGVIRTKSDLSTNARLEIIYNELNTLIDKFQPNECAIESLFFNKNTKTAISVAQARGVVLLLCEQKKIKTTDYTPLQVKQSIVGYGKATKQQVQFMTQKVLNLKNKITPDDAADAVAIAICHINAKNFNDKIQLNNSTKKEFIDKSYKTFK